MLTQCLNQLIFAKQMKTFTDQQVTDMIKLRWGKEVTHPGHPTLTSY